MATLFEDKSGYIVRTQGGSATRALLRVTAGDQEMSAMETLFVTTLSVRRGTTNNVVYSLDNRIFLSAAGDALGSLRLQGMVFSAICGKGGGRGQQGATYGGLSRLTEFYNNHKLKSGGQDISSIDVVYNDRTDWVKHVGYIHAVSMTTSPDISAAMDFTLECYLVP